MASAANNDGEPPQKRTKKNQPQPQPQPQILSMPNDVLLSCLARVPRRYHPTLSLVCKSFHSLMASPELQATRSLLGRIDHNNLYFCIRDPDKATRRWFTLCHKPSNPRAHMAVPIPSPHPLAMYFGAVAVVDSEIYVIGGLMKCLPSSSMWVLECGSHTWRQAPSMRVARVHARACVLDGKIYVMGGRGCISSVEAEVFDPKTQTWETLPSPDHLGGIGWYSTPTAIDSKLYIMHSTNYLVYDPRKGAWDVEDMSFRPELFGETCMVENVLYKYDDNELNWYDSRTRQWRQVKGLERLLGYCPNRMGNHCGKLVFFMDRVQPREIWCAEIALERRSLDEIWGQVKVESMDVLLRTHHLYSLCDSFVVTV